MIKCPNCSQKLMLPASMLIDSKVICPKCGHHLKVASRNPDRLEDMGPNASLNKNAKPESYA